MNRLHIFLLLISVTVFTQCIPPTEEVITDINIDFKEKKLQRLYLFQDQQKSDSLFQFLRDKDPTFRYMSAMAFGSLQDARALDSLEILLQDPSDDVKVAAAYAIGQIGESASEEKLLAAFDQMDSSGVHHHSNAAILEAIGKSSTKKYLNPLSAVSTYQSTDTLLLEGQAWSIYRYALRDITSPQGTERMVALATTSEYPASVRMIASNYLYRAKKINLKDYDKIIADAFIKEDDPRVRMTLAIALGKTKSETAELALIGQFRLERDPRVKANIIRALSNFDYVKMEPIILKALTDENQQVATVASEFFIDHGMPQSATAYWRTAKDTALHWQTQINLYTAANKHIPVYFAENKKFINWELKRRFETSLNNYEKAEIVRSLGGHGWNYAWIKRMAFPSEVPVIRTASIQALSQILLADNFDKTFGLSARRIRKELIGYIVEAVENGDPGMIAVSAELLRNKKEGFKASLDSLNFLENALIKLDLPREIETYNEVVKTLNYLKSGKDLEEAKPKFNHPIDWITFNDIEKEATATLQTTKGDIVIDLMPDLAPGTVVNFVRLVKNGFYKNKFFHRVVPNFVIQTGCPRGDGYGSLDYTLRSELPYLHYDEGGYVGMASAGNNTEGTQFFITHSPTPHLDGRYTIFGKVSKGMDVVQQISVGDSIEEVTLD
jgi:cyclophilin family peptidyl-prolyl cis-trans isomerase/HEAT repeat protein